jgi:hypothetical protein
MSSPLTPCLSLAASRDIPTPSPVISHRPFASALQPYYYCNDTGANENHAVEQGFYGLMFFYDFLGGIMCAFNVVFGSLFELVVEVAFDSQLHRPGLTTVYYDRLRYNQGSE